MSCSIQLACLAHRIWRHKGPISTLLLPLSWLTRLIVSCKRRRFAKPSAQTRGRAPIIVVGNIYVGGTGKTPVTIALVQGLRALGWTPGIVSRGYGVKKAQAARTGIGQLDPAQFGDEPALIARCTGAPVAVHPRRGLALRALEAAYPEVDVIIADDGLQHLALARDIEVAVQDSRGIGNGRLLPAGPLREPAGRLRHVDYLIVNLEAGQRPPKAPGTVPVVCMRLLPERMEHLATHRIQTWNAWFADHGKDPVSAVAGIGRPRRFFRMLAASGLTLADAVALPDHATFRDSPFDALGQRPILITAKDAIKCAAHARDGRLWVVHATPHFSDEHWIGHIARRLRAAPGPA